MEWAEQHTGTQNPPKMGTKVSKILGFDGWEKAFQNGPVYTTDFWMEKLQSKEGHRDTEEACRFEFPSQRFVWKLEAGAFLEYLVLMSAQSLGRFCASDLEFPGEKLLCQKKMSEQL